jgi:hypothetical protein
MEKSVMTTLVAAIAVAWAGVGSVVVRWGRSGYGTA